MGKHIIPGTESRLCAYLNFLGWTAVNGNLRPLRIWLEELKATFSSSTPARLQSSDNSMMENAFCIHLTAYSPDCCWATSEACGFFRNVLRKDFPISRSLAARDTRCNK